MANEPTIVISRDGQQFGPYSLSQVNGYLVSGHLKADDLAWDARRSAWIPLHRYPGAIVTQPPPPSRPSGYRPAAPTVTRARYAAGESYMGCFGTIAHALSCGLLIFIAVWLFFGGCLALAAHLPHPTMSDAQMANLMRNGALITCFMAILVAGFFTILIGIGSLYQASHGGRNFGILTVMWLFWFFLFWLVFGILIGISIFATHPSPSPNLGDILIIRFFAFALAFLTATWGTMSGWLPGTRHRD